MIPIEKSIQSIRDALGAAAGKIDALERRLNRISASDGDGQWIIVPPYLSFSPISATPTQAQLVAVPRGCTILKWVVGMFVQTTNSAVSYWRLDLATTTIGTIASINSSADTVNTWTKHTATSFSTATIPNTEVYFIISANKAGATATPGNLFLTSSALYIV